MNNCVDSDENHSETRREKTPGENLSGFPVDFWRQCPILVLQCLRPPKFDKKSTQVFTQVFTPGPHPSSSPQVFIQVCTLGQENPWLGRLYRCAITVMNNLTK